MRQWPSACGPLRPERLSVAAIPSGRIMRICRTNPFNERRWLRPGPINHDRLDLPIRCCQFDFQFEVSLYSRAKRLAEASTNSMTPDAMSRTKTLYMDCMLSLPVISLAFLFSRRNIAPLKIKKVALFSAQEFEFLIWLVINRFHSHPSPTKGRASPLGGSA